eukprot:374106_1
MGDGGECYEYALWTAANKLKWTQNARSKALVVIGDMNLDCLEITCFGIYCRFMDEQYQHFYEQIAQRTNGKYLELSNIQNITRYFVALCIFVNVIFILAQHNKKK